MTNPVLTRTARGLAARMARATRLVATLAIALSAQPGMHVLAQEQFVLKLGSPAPIGSPWHEHLQAIARQLEESAGGHLRVKLLAGGALGDDADVLQPLCEGRVQAYATRISALAPIAPSLAVLAAPNVFAAGKSSYRQLDRGLRNAVARELTTAGLVFGSWSIAEPRLWLSRAKPIRKPRDLRGAKLASSRSASLAALAQIFSMTPVDLANLDAAALVAAEIDVIDDTLLSAVATGRDRWARHATLDDHALDPWLVVYSARWFDGLPEQIQRDLAQLPNTLLQDARSQLEATRKPLVERLRSRGVDVHEPTRSEQRALRRVGRAATQRLARELGPSARRLLGAASR